jgi:putative transposase
LAKKKIKHCPLILKRGWVDPNHPKISIKRQCELIDVVRSSYYYKPEQESEQNLRLMKLIDEEFTEHPFYGTRRMTVFLRQKGEAVSRKRVKRLMRIMDLEAVYPKPKLSKKNPDHQVYPYLLKDVKINRPNQVWSTDITYIRLLNGFVYLVAIMDWYSRYVISWEVSTSLEVDFCLTALERALKIGKPDIFNSDQGSQFTSKAFTQILESTGIKISMDGRGRVFDNIFIERLWRSLKYEKVYLSDWMEVHEARAGINEYFQFYNYKRPHQGINDKKPFELHKKYLLK